MLISDWVPPIAKKAIRKIKPAYKAYSSLEAAEASLPSASQYNHDVITDIVLAKTQRYQKELQLRMPPTLEGSQLFLIAALGVLPQKRLKVLDLGGAFGAHYFLAKRYFPQTDFEWTVLEVPKVVQKGQVLENEELRFLDLKGELSQKIGDFDLVFTSATLQHMPDPELALNFLLMQNAPNLLLLRLGLNAQSTHLWVHDRARYQDCGPGPAITSLPDGVVSLPFCLLSASRFESSLKDYELKLEAIDHSGVKWLNKGITGFNRLYQRKS